MKTVFVVFKRVAHEGSHLQSIHSTLTKATNAAQAFIKEEVDFWNDKNCQNNITLISDGLWTVRIEEKNTQYPIDGFQVAIEELEVD